MKSWSLDLRKGNALADRFIKNAALFVDDLEGVEGHQALIHRLQELFGQTPLHFKPSFKELSGHFGYEFGNLLFTINQSQKNMFCEYSIVWTSHAGQWKILSHTITSENNK